MFLRERRVKREFMLVKTILQTVCILSMILLARLSAEASQLIFEQVRIDGIVFGAGNTGFVPQDYGDRVGGLSQSVLGGTFSYGNLGEGFTPNVLVSYGLGARLWSDSYGDLNHIVWNSVFAPLEITMTADPGFLVKLHDFDLGGWPNWDYTINSIQVLDGENNLLFSQNNVYVEGDSNGPRHSHFDLPSIQAESLLLRIDMLNLGGQYDRIGIDNIRFSQSEARANDGPSNVPEPNSALLLAAAFVGVVAFKRGKIKRIRS